MQCHVKDTSCLIYITDTLNEKPIPNHMKLVFLDIVNIFLSIDNQRMQAVLNLLNSCSIEKPSIDCLIEGLKLYLYDINSVFANKNLLQTKVTATDALNACS